MISLSCLNACNKDLIILFGHTFRIISLVEHVILRRVKKRQIYVINNTYKTNRGRAIQIMINMSQRIVIM